MELTKNIKYNHIRFDFGDNIIEVAICTLVQQVDNRKLVTGIYYIQRASDIDPTSLKAFQAVLKDKYPSLVEVEIQDFLRFYMRNPLYRQELYTLCQAERQLKGQEGFTCSGLTQDH